MHDINIKYIMTPPQSLAQPITETGVIGLSDGVTVAVRMCGYPLYVDHYQDRRGMLRSW